MYTATTHHPTSAGPRRTELHTPGARRRPAGSRRHGVTALACAVVAVLISPALLLIPVAGALPALVAGAGAVAGWIGLRCDDTDRILAAIGFVSALVVLVLTAGAALLWTVFVVDPAISQFPELQEALRRLLPG